MFKKIWAILNGKKTAIGMVLIAIVTACEQVGWIPAGSAEFLIAILGAFGVTAIGVGHKLYKAGASACDK